jgi:hypothetical protein
VVRTIRFCSEAKGFAAIRNLSVLLGVLLMPCNSRASDRENLQLSTAQWREDLQFIARELPKRHLNAFHSTSRERFEASVADLDRRLPQLDAAQVYVGMLRIVNSVGDGHTHLRFPVHRDSFPLGIDRFGNDYRVVCSAPSCVKALGARVLGINDTPIGRVRELILSVTPQDETPQYREALVSGWMTIGILLHGLGITRASAAARFKFIDDNDSEFSINVHPDQTTERRWAYATESRHIGALFRERPDETFWYTWLPESRTVYCNWRTYKDLRKQAAGLLAFVKAKRPDKLVIDLRENGGGDYFVGLRNMVRPIRDLPEINRKGHLFVLIGPFTFSAAMSNAAHFRQQTAAILVGMPIGEKPNSYQEVKSVTLPNCHLTLRYSTKFYKFVETAENVIRPDQEIDTSWLDFKAGRDPVLEWVVKHKP